MQRRAIEQLAVHRQRQPDDDGDLDHVRRERNLIQRRGRRLQQRALVEQIGARVAGEAQLWEDRQAAALPGSLPQRGDDRLRVEGDVGHAQLRRDHRRAHEAEGCGREEQWAIHERLRWLLWVRFPGILNEGRGEVNNATTEERRSVLCRAARPRAIIGPASPHP